MTTINNKFVIFARENLFNRKDRSTWKKGVTEYAHKILDNIEERIQYEGKLPDNKTQFRLWMLNGATDWKEASYGGCYEVYDRDIAQRLCTPSELKRNRNGELNPNSRETWLDVQARALFQASVILMRLWNEYNR